jgi:hypothetical protein
MRGNGTLQLQGNRGKEGGRGERERPQHRSDVNELTSIFNAKEDSAASHITANAVTQKMHITKGRNERILHDNVSR